MLKIVSTSERRVPGRDDGAERRAVLDEPPLLAVEPDEVRDVVDVGCAPVAIDEAQTGVSDGNVEIARA